MNIDAVRLHNADMGPRTSKRTRGTIGNIANQLAQITTGFNAINDGPVLLAEEASSGRYAINAIKRVSIVNGHEAELGMVHALAQWLEGELQRLGRAHDWLTEAQVAVDYVLMPSDRFMEMNAGYWTSFAFVAKLSAVARVVTADGTASSSSENVQALAGQGRESALGPSLLDKLHPATPPEAGGPGPPG